MADLRVVDTNYGLLIWCLLYGVVHVSPQATVYDAPPQIQYPLSQDRLIVYKDIDVVQCKASGHPPPTFQWKRNDRPLNDTGESVKAFPNGTLDLKNFVDSDNGLYQCLASNKYGTAVSVKVPIVKRNINVDISVSMGLRGYEEIIGKLFAEGIAIPRELVTQEVQEGDPANLKCASPLPTVPPGIIKWRGKTETEDNEITLDERIGIDSEGTLRFAYTKSSDSKQYISVLRARDSKPPDATIDLNEIKLKVNPRNSVPPTTRPVSEFSSADVKAVLGTIVTLQCFFSGHPVSNITWKSKSNKEIQSTDGHFVVRDFGREMRIINVTQDDEGTFTCTGINGYGDDSRYINVNVTSPPMKVPKMGLYGETKPDRGTIVLHCKARPAFGENINTPVWYRNGQLMTQENLPDPQRYSFNEDYTELSITEPDKIMDTASFQCNVSNSEGYTFYDGHLKVIESIKIIKQPASVIEISSNDVIDISVQAKGDSCCKINKLWELNKVTLTSEDLINPPFVWDLSADSLMFDASKVSNVTLPSKLGKYKCRVNNSFDFQEVEFSISMKAVAPNPDTLTEVIAGVELWWIGLLLGILFLIVAAIVIFIIIKTRYPGQTYELEKTELKHHLNPKEDLLEQSFQEI